MKKSPRYRDRAVSLAILGVLPTLLASIPVLDVWAQDSRVGIEDHHHPGTHGYPHNHLICIQQEANQWAPAADLPTAPSRRIASHQARGLTCPVSLQSTMIGGLEPPAMASYRRCPVARGLPNTR